MLSMGGELNSENGRHQLGDRALGPLGQPGAERRPGRHRGHMRFRGTVVLGGKTATGIEVPPEVVSEVGQGRKRVPVIARIGSYSYRTTIAPMSGSFFIPLAAEHRAAIGAAAGDEIDVDLVPDMAPRTVEIPADLAAALDTHRGARAAFDALSYTATGGE
jgi:Domain of unknown function (DUF1905)/Bacteriocin-protection, YdeI or OmpD-Associated